MTHIDLKVQEQRKQRRLTLAVTSRRASRDGSVFGQLIPDLKQVSSVGVEQAQVFDRHRESVRAEHEGGDNCERRVDHAFSLEDGVQRQHSTPSAYPVQASSTRGTRGLQGENVSPGSQSPAIGILAQLLG